MKFHSNSSLAVGALLLTGLWMTAPAASGAPGRKAQSSQPANIAVDHAGGNGVRRADTGKSGDNPLYEGKDKANLKSNAGASTVEYKDPEDMTTRYRPGNNKTTSSIAVDHAGGNGVRRADGGQSASGPAAESGISSGSSAEAHATARTKKHLAGVKYEDRIAGDNSGGTAGQSAQGSAQRKGGSIVIHDREGTAAQRKDGSIVHSDFPRFADRNSAHATESLSPSNGGSNNAPGLAVNEQGSTKQGSSSAPVRHRH